MSAEQTAAVHGTSKRFSGDTPPVNGQVLEFVSASKSVQICETANAAVVAGLFDQSMQDTSGLLGSDGQLLTPVTGGIWKLIACGSVAVGDELITALSGTVTEKSAAGTPNVFWRAMEAASDTEEFVGEFVIGLSGGSA